MTQALQPWWKTATGYQIYPRSFCDSNGDGIGDLQGIISKLDHLRDLGVGFVWLSPVYASPMRDNGYDISDYRDIAPEFGTLEDFDQLVAQAQDKGIRIVMDLVVNHCSSDHDWFLKACETRDCPEHAYFYWRDQSPETNGPPDDQRACFGGSAWTWVEAVGRYYYGHFGPGQPDLNWHNPALRHEVFDMMNWWLDKGIGGFRIDVIELIGKDLDTRIYAEGPDMHRFIQDMHQACFAGRDIMTVGESWSAKPDTALLYCGDSRHEVDMVFNFNHIDAAWDQDKGRFGPNLFDLPTHKRILASWQDALANDGWNSLYLSNHDLPRPVSHYGCEGPYRVRSAKMLAMTMHLMKGTPFIYQGEEIGMTNAHFTEIGQFRDIETLGQLKEQSARGVSQQEFIAGANTNGRDNGRTPVQWDGTKHAGFTTGQPWIDVNTNYVDINVEEDRSDPNGVFAFYQNLIALRGELDIITKGSFALIGGDDPNVFAYERALDDQRLLVFGNFTDKTVHFQMPETRTTQGKIVLSNLYRDALPSGDHVTLAPFEAFACLLE
ncbi:glycoside hydrolase family 13 protein [Celeribacter baekdonensis]|uniref:glycoside hydrolase family 13 protein n=1 Tax=Celeribacter baekdonensis TaxID=875171 RepID=UPI003A8F5929